MHQRKTIEGKTKVKRKILLIAPLRANAVGGQAKIANYILDYLQNDFEIYSVSLPLPRQYNNFFRFLKSWHILFKALYICIFKRIGVVHLLTSCHRAALYEKLFFIFIFRCLGKKTILNFQGAFDVFYFRYTQFDLFLIPLLIRRSSAVHCLHEGIKIFLIEKQIMPEENIFVIANGIETAGTEQIILTQKNMLNILFLGWLTYNKGIDLLIEAVAIIQKKNSKIFHLHIYGPEMEPGIKKKLIALIEKCALKNSVSIHDTVQGDEKKNVLANADIFVLPTRSEGFPNAILEAMLLGLPVIASDIAPLNKIITHNENGMLFKLNDATALSFCLNHLINDFELRQKIGANARNRIIENYDIKKVILQLGDLYLHLAGK